MKRTKKVVLSLAVVAMVSLAFGTTVRADHRSRARGCYVPPVRQYYYSPPRHGHYHHGGGYYVPPRRYYYAPPAHGHHHHHSGFGIYGRNFSLYFGH